ncbi:hypothetical protein BFINE_21570 [Bacteroides finegoldii DSM 17565]|nr:hypothetical protein BFINE_21570 [Bacteroides finegoldii DSM 17565]
MHTALAYFQAGRPEEAYRLMKSSFLDGMYLGNSPGNLGKSAFMMLPVESVIVTLEIR